jgi:cell division protein FtsN
LAQDDYYYEIQLTNKQLVFYFLAGSAALVLSFLAGVKVGRGVEETASADAAGARRVLEDRVVTPVEEPPATRPPQAEELTYAERLEKDRVDDTLEKPASSSEPATSAAQKPVTVADAKPPAVTAPSKPAATLAPVKPSAVPPTPAAKPSVKPTPTPKPPATAPAAASAPKPVSGTFTIQVGAFKDRATADTIASRLKGKGYSAYVVAPDGPDGGLFNVRVGTYPARADAERTQARLRDEEKYKPFIVRN